MPLNLEQKETLVDAANSVLGTTYMRGASASFNFASDKRPRHFDCISFVRYVYRTMDMDIGNTMLAQASNVRASVVEPEPGLENLETGDLVFFQGSRGTYDFSLFGGRPAFLGYVSIFVTEPFSESDVLYGARHRLGGVVAQPVQELLSEPHFENPSIVKRF